MYDFIRQTSPTCIPLYVVFSNEADFDSFEMQSSVVPIIVPLDGWMGAHGVVNFKKLYALQQLENSDHDYFIVCDSEISAVMPNFDADNILRQVEHIVHTRRVYSGKTSDPFIMNIMEQSACLFKNAGFRILEKYHSRIHTKHLVERLASVSTDSPPAFLPNHIVRSYIVASIRSFDLSVLPSAVL
jgi:hypothetical protein